MQLVYSQHVLRIETFSWMKEFVDTLDSWYLLQSIAAQCTGCLRQLGMKVVVWCGG